MDMMQFTSFDRIGAVATVMTFALAVITDKLVWHTRLKKAEARADRWEKVALDALTAGAQAGIKAAEVTVGVVGAFPDPELLRERARAAAEAIVADAATAADAVMANAVVAADAVMANAAATNAATTAAAAATQKQDRRV